MFIFLSYVKTNLINSQLQIDVIFVILNNKCRAQRTKFIFQHDQLDRKDQH